MTDTARAGYIKGLRELADALEGNDSLPLPYTGTGTEICFYFLSGSDPRAELAAAVRVLGCTWTKRVTDETSEYPSYLDLDGSLHGLRIKLTALRDAVCERVVTGTREVTDEVPDPEALAKVPVIKVPRIVEEVRWRCGPILAGLDEADPELGDAA